MIPTDICNIIRSYVEEMKEFSEKFNKYGQFLYELALKLETLNITKEIILEKLERRCTNMIAVTHLGLIPYLEQQLILCKKHNEIIENLCFEFHKNQTFCKNTEQKACLAFQHTIQIFELLEIFCGNFAHILKFALKNAPYEEWLVKNNFEQL